MASQILTPFDVTGAASAATRRASSPARPRPSRWQLDVRPALGRELAWLLVPAAAGLVAAAAASAWMVDSIRLF